MKKGVILIAALFGAVGAFAQETDTAKVPFTVNVNATVKAELKGADGVTVLSQAQMSVTANAQSTLRVPLPKEGVGVLNGAQRRLNVPAVISNRGGKISLNLSAQSYKNAEVALYTVSGKRVLRKKVSAASAASNISLPNIATGAYLLSVKGTEGAAVTSRVTHSGGGLGISVSYGNESTASASRLSKKAEGEWTITVSAPNYKDREYALNLVNGQNEPQTVTLELRPDIYVDARDGYMYKKVTIGNQVWTAENLNYTPSIDSAGNSWCYGNSADSCAKYGRLYDWSTAKTVCPLGWQLPSSAEWNDLVTTVGSSAGAKLKSTSGWNNDGNGTDNFGFSALPGGGRIVAGAFSGAGELGNWWTATEAGSGKGYIWQMGKNNDGVSEFDYSVGIGFSVRCLQSEYTVAVSSAGTGATGGGDYKAGATVNIYAGTPPDGQAFKNWTTLSSGVIFASENDSRTTFTMPPTAVTVTATFGLPPPVVTSFTDSRDNKSYQKVTIGDKTWMAQNLNYEPSIESAGNSWCYGNYTEHCSMLGRLYDWNTANTVCPSGWHLPSRVEWSDLVTTVGSSAGTKLKVAFGWKTRTDGSSGNGTNDYGFGASPGGSVEGGSFSGGEEFGHWWTATEDGNGGAYRRSMSSDDDSVTEMGDNTGKGISVRCVTD